MKARGPSRNRRFRLECLEERALLSTYTLSEFYFFNTPAVTETVNNVTTIHYNAHSPFVVNTGAGNNTVNILDTSAHVAINVNGGGSDVVNLGNAGSVQGILGAVAVENPPDLTTLNINDSADQAARTVTLSTFTPFIDSPWGTITGLAPAAISYEYADTSSVHLTTGHGPNTVNVLATGVPTYLNSGGGSGTVNAGNGGSVQGILGALYVENTPSFNTLNVVDSTDPAARAVTLNTITPGFDPVPWGSITGLAPAAISYEYADTSSVHLITGHGADTVNVLATGTLTNINSGGGADTVNVGNGGSVQGILGALYVENSPSFNSLNVDDSADLAARVVTLSNITPWFDAVPWGSITGLAPAAISYEYSDTTSVHLTTGHGADTVNVLATGVATYLNSNGGSDTVNVGNGGSVQGILGALYVENPPSFTTLNINDSADFAVRHCTLSTITPGFDPVPWGSITGLAPAAINFEWADVHSPVNISTVPRFATWTVNNNALANVIGVVVKDNGNQIN
jgi:hypothetical protein